jgi:hypothetical protein
LAQPPEPPIAAAAANTSDRPTPKIGLVFLILWIAVNVFATSISGKNSITIGHYFGEPIGVYISYGFVGAIVGFGQWLILRKVVNRAKWWIILTALAEAIVGPHTNAIAFRLSLASGGMIDPLATAAIIRGASVGLFQSTLLFGQFPRAALWIVAVAASKCLSASIGSELIEHSSTFTLVPNLTAALNALLTGLALIWLLRPQSAQAKSKEAIAVNQQPQSPH